MGEKNRASLKNLFLKGKIPKEKDFHDLLDSTINKEDDGISKIKEKDLKYYRQEATGRSCLFLII